MKNQNIPPVEVPSARSCAKDAANLCGEAGRVRPGAPRPQHIPWPSPLKLHVGWPDKEQAPCEPWQIPFMGCKSTCQATSLVRLRQRVPKAHMSTTVARHNGSRHKAASAGACHNTDWHGFSSTAGTLKRKAIFKMRTVARIWTFRQRTFSWSAAGTFATPSGFVLDRNGPPGVPGTPRRARDQDMQGVAIMTPAMHPGEIQPQMCSAASRRSRSKRGLSSISTATAPAATRPVPANSSKKTCEVRLRFISARSTLFRNAYVSPPLAGAA